MAITVANCITDLNDQLKVSESTDSPSTAVLNALTKALRWLSRQANWSCLHTSASPTTTEGAQSVDYPANFRKLDYIVVNDGTYDGKPLTKITFRKWLRKRRDETSADYDEPTKFAQRGKKFYLEPRPDSNDGNNYTVTVWYWRWHPGIAALGTTILFPDEFSQVVFDAFAGAYLDRKGRHGKARYYWGMAEKGALELEGDFADRKARIIKYRDMGI